MIKIKSLIISILLLSSHYLFSQPYREGNPQLVTEVSHVIVKAMCAELDYAILKHIGWSKDYSYRFLLQTDLNNEVLVRKEINHFIYQMEILDVMVSWTKIQTGWASVYRIYESEVIMTIIIKQTDPDEYCELIISLGTIKENQ